MECLAIAVLAWSQYLLWKSLIPAAIRAWKELRFWQQVNHLENCLKEKEATDV